MASGGICLCRRSVSIRTAVDASNVDRNYPQAMDGRVSLLHKRVHLHAKILEPFVVAVLFSKPPLKHSVSSFRKLVKAAWDFFLVLYDLRKLIEQKHELSFDS